MARPSVRILVWLVQMTSSQLFITYNELQTLEKKYIFEGIFVPRQL